MSAIKRSIKSAHLDIALLCLAIMSFDVHDDNKLSQANTNFQRWRELPLRQQHFVSSTSNCITHPRLFLILLQERSSHLVKCTSIKSWMDRHNGYRILAHSRTLRVRSSSSPPPQPPQHFPSTHPRPTSTLSTMRVENCLAPYRCWL